jgi:hypothetical protein
MFKISFPDLETRKIHTRNAIEKFNLLTENLIKDKLLRCGLLYFFHIFIVGSTFLIILFSPINIFFYIFLLIWLIIMLMHIYFGGCIFIRIERELLDDKSWKGIWTHLFDILEYFGYEITNEFSNNIFICMAIIICFIIFLKFIYFL